MVLSTPADIAFVGGAAGCGKTFLLEVEPTRYSNVSKFGGIIFRRTSPQITAQGGLWDTSETIYPLVGGVPKKSRLEWFFKKWRIAFRHLEYEKNILDYQGSQIPYIGFDELTHFSDKMFWYLMSRNRTECGVKPYMRATMNPDPNSWVAPFIEQWIDQDSGFPIKEMAGVLRYFVRDGETVVWGENPKQVIEKCPHIFENDDLRRTGVPLEEMVKSFTFIPGNIYDNQLFIKRDPSYLATLLSLQEEEKLRLLQGNWKISLDGMQIAKHEKIEQIYDNYPSYMQQRMNPTYRPFRCITCDAARFGRDLCVIFVWEEWTVIHTVVYHKSHVHDVVAKIESLRLRFTIPLDQVLIDQDGVGGDTVKLGRYEGFRGNAPPVRDIDTRIKENYFNLKTQCYYRLCEMRINTNEIRFEITNSTCEVYDDSSLEPRWSTKVKIGGKVWDIRELLKKQLRTVRRSDTDKEGKLKIESKQQQVVTLGHSPDFADTAMMREAVELLPKRISMRRKN